MVFAFPNNVATIWVPQVMGNSILAFQSLYDGILSLWQGIPRMILLEVFGVYDVFGVYGVGCFVGFSAYTNDAVFWGIHQ